MLELEILTWGLLEAEAEAEADTDIEALELEDSRIPVSEPKQQRSNRTKPNRYGIPAVRGKPKPLEANYICPGCGQKMLLKLDTKNRVRQAKNKLVLCHRCRKEVGR